MPCNLVTHDLLPNGKCLKKCKVAAGFAGVGYARNAGTNRCEKTVALARHQCGVRRFFADTKKCLMPCKRRTVRASNNRCVKTPETAAFEDALDQDAVADATAGFTALNGLRLRLGGVNGTNLYKIHPDDVADWRQRLNRLRHTANQETDQRRRGRAAHLATQRADILARREARTERDRAERLEAQRADNLARRNAYTARKTAAAARAAIPATAPIAPPTDSKARAPIPATAPIAPPAAVLKDGFNAKGKQHTNLQRWRFRIIDRSNNQHHDIDPTCRDGLPALALVFEGTSKEALVLLPNTITAAPLTKAGLPNKKTPGTLWKWWEKYLEYSKPVDPADPENRNWHENLRNVVCLDVATHRPRAILHNLFLHFLDKPDNPRASDVCKTYPSLTVPATGKPNTTLIQLLSEVVARARGCTSMKLEDSHEFTRNGITMNSEVSALYGNGFYTRSPYFFTPIDPRRNQFYDTLRAKSASAFVDRVRRKRPELLPVFGLLGLPDPASITLYELALAIRRVMEGAKLSAATAESINDFVQYFRDEFVLKQISKAFPEMKKGRLVYDEPLRRFSKDLTYIDVVSSVQDPASRLWTITYEVDAAKQRRITDLARRTESSLIL